MPFCTKCGNENPESSRFCPKCGKPVAPPATMPVATQSNYSSGQTPGTEENLSLWGYFIKCFKNYANFRGRARRKEFWGFTLFNVLIMVGVSVVGGATGGVMAAVSGNANEAAKWGATLGGILYWIYALAQIVPNIAVYVRRMHDIGKSGWNCLWFLVLAPIGGTILLGLLGVDFYGVFYGSTHHYSYYATDEKLLIQLAFIFAVGVGPIYLFIRLCTQGNSKKNKYGPSPKGGEA